MVDTKTSRYSWPNSTIFLLICILPVVSTLVFGAVDNTTWALITIFWAAILLLWTIESWTAGEIRFSDHAIQIPLFGFLVIGIIQLLPFGAAGEVTDALSIPASNAISIDPHSTRFFISRLAVYIIFLAGGLTFVRTKDRLRKVVILVIIFGSAMAFFGILQRLANPEGIYGMRETPQAIPFGPFVNQHHFASFMQMTSGLTLAFLLGATLKLDKKILLLIALVVMSAATILTGSRGGFIGIFSVFLLVIVLHAISGRWSNPAESASLQTGRLRSVGGPIALVCIALLVLGVVLFIGGEDSLMRGIGLSLDDPDITTGRSHFWSVALKMFLDHPFIGVGWEAFGVAFTPYDTNNGYFRVDQAHNEYLQVLAEGGILGFACLAAFIYLLFRKSWRTIRRSSGMIREASIGALAGCFGIMVHSVFDFPLRTPSNAFFFLLLSAIAVFPASRAGKS